MKLFLFWFLQKYNIAIKQYKMHSITSKRHMNLYLVIGLLCKKYSLALFCCQIIKYSYIIIFYYTLILFIINIYTTFRSFNN